MKLLSKLAFTLLSLAILGACAALPTTQKKWAQRSSNETSLIPIEGYRATPEVVEEDLTRQAYISKKGQEVYLEKDKKGTVKIFPLTLPYIFSLTKSYVDDKAFAEKLTEEEKKTEEIKMVNRIFRDAFNNSIYDRKSCFMLDIYQREGSFNQKHWHGSVSQGGGAEPLEFVSEVKEIPKVHSYLDKNESLHSYTVYNYMAKVCSKLPLQFENTFEVVIEPRYERDLQPMKFVWLSPNKVDVRRSNAAR